MLSSIQRKHVPRSGLSSLLQAWSLCSRSLEPKMRFKADRTWKLGYCIQKEKKVINNLKPFYKVQEILTTIMIYYSCVDVSLCRWSAYRKPTVFCFVVTGNYTEQVLIDAKKSVAADRYQWAQISKGHSQNQVQAVCPSSFSLNKKYLINIFILTMN